MLSSEERSFIYQNAYIPEHLIEYVCSISEAEPCLFEGYLYYLKGSHIIFIGYPLSKEFSETEASDILLEILNKYKIKSAAVISPKNLKFKGQTIIENSDSYYILELSKLSLTEKLKNSIKRAKKELTIELSKKFTPSHSSIIEEYINTKKFDEYTTHIFQKIPRYIYTSKTSLLINAKNKNNSLVGFNILDLGSKNYAFYMFNFISKKSYTPGVSDLLMFEMTEITKKEGKEFINLGLGINQGVLFFKKKWGGKFFLGYQFTYQKIFDEQNSPIKSILRLFKNL